MDKPKFQVGDVVTNKTTGLTKTILAFKGDHYLTDVGIIRFDDEKNWEKGGTK